MPREELPERRLRKNKKCEKVIFPQDSNLQSLDYRLTALPLQLERMPFCMLNFSSVARGGGGEGGLSPPHWPVKYAKSHVFGAFEADFCWKNKNSHPQKEFGSRSCEVVAVIRPEKTFEYPNLAEKYVSVSVKTFFLEITCFWAEKLFKFPTLAEKSVWFWWKNNENSGKDCLQLSHSFQKAPSFFKSWLRACLILAILTQHYDVQYYKELAKGLNIKTLVCKHQNNIIKFLSTLRILNGITWDFTQAKWWMWWKTVKCGGLIPSCCPHNPHEKADNEERRKKFRILFKTILKFCTIKQLLNRYVESDKNFRFPSFWHHFYKLLRIVLAVVGSN